MTITPRVQKTIIGAKKAIDAKKVANFNEYVQGYFDSVAKSVKSPDPDGKEALKVQAKLRAEYVDAAFDPTLDFGDADKVIACGEIWGAVVNRLSLSIARDPALKGREKEIFERILYIPIELMRAGRNEPFIQQAVIDALLQRGADGGGGLTTDQNAFLKEKEEWATLAANAAATAAQAGRNAKVLVANVSVQAALLKQMVDKGANPLSAEHLALLDNKDNAGLVTAAADAAIAASKSLVAAPKVQEELIRRMVAAAADPLPAGTAELLAANPGLVAAAVAAVGLHPAAVSLAANPSVAAARALGAKAPQLAAARNVATMGPALHALTDLNDADLDALIAQHANTEALDLAVIAVRRAADAAIIAHIGGHGLAGDPLVAAALEVAGADDAGRLAIAQLPRATVEQLQALTLVNSADLDAEIVQRPNTLTADLGTIAARTQLANVANLRRIVGHRNAGAGVLDAVMANANLDAAARTAVAGNDKASAEALATLTLENDAALDALIVRRVNTLTADLGTIAARTPLANVANLRRIVGHRNADAGVLDAVMANAHVDDGARVAVAAKNHASAGALTTLTLRNNAALDTLIVQRPNTLTADLGTIAARTLLANVANLTHIAGHRNVDAGVLDAVMANAHVDAAARTAVAGNDKASAGALNTLTLRNNADLDALIVQRPNTEAADLVTIARRRAAVPAIIADIRRHPLALAGNADVAAALFAIDNAANLALAANNGATGPELQALTLLNNPVLDALIVQRPNTLTADLGTIAARTPLANVANLAHIAGHRNVDAAGLDAVMANAHVDAAARTAVAGNDKASAEALATLTLRNNADLDALIVQRPNTKVADLGTIAARTPLANVANLAHIAGHRNVDAAGLDAVMANVHVDAAARTAVAGNDKASAGALTTLTLRNNAALDTLIVQRPNTLTADLGTIAARTPLADVANLAHIAGHRNVDAGVLDAVMANAHVDAAARTAVAGNDKASAGALNTLTLRDNADLDALIVQRPNTEAADLVTIARRRAAVPAIIADIRRHPLALAGNADVAAALFAIDNAANLALAANNGATGPELQALTLLNNPVLDALIVQRPNTLTADLGTIAARTPLANVANLAHIAGHRNVDAAGLDAVMANAHVDAAARTAVAGNDKASAEALATLTLRNNADLDALIVQRPNTKVADLGTIAARTLLANVANLAHIAGHRNVDAGVLDAVMANAHVDDAARTAVATNNLASAGALNTLTLRNNAALDTLIAQRPNTLTADLGTIAARTLLANVANLAHIAGHRNVDAGVLDAVMANAHVDAAARTAVAGNDKASAGALNTLTLRDNADLDALIVQRPNTEAADLVTIARRRAAVPAIIADIRRHPLALAGNADVAAALFAIDNAANLALAANNGATGPELQALTLLNNPVLDALIVQRPNTLTADLGTIAARTPLANVANLAHIAGHRNVDAAGLDAVMANAHVDAAARTAVAGNDKASAEALATLTLRNNADLDALIVQRPNTKVADLGTIAARTPLANVANLRRIVGHRNVDAAGLDAVMANVHVDAAARTAVAGNDKASAGALTTLTLRNNAALDTLIAQRPNTLTADLGTIAARTLLANVANLAHIAGHRNVDAGVLDAVMANAHVGAAARTAVAGNNKASAGALNTLTLRNNADLDALIVQRPNTEAADLVTIARRRAAVPAIIADIRRHPLALAGNADVAAALFAIDNAANLALAANNGATGPELQALTLLNNPVLDALIVQRPNTLTADLGTIAARTPLANVANLAHIAGHRNVDAAGLDAVMANAHVDAAARTAVAGNDKASAEALATLTLRNNADLDALIVQRPNTKVADLGTIAARTPLANVANLRRIVGHRNVDAAGLDAVMANVHVDAAARTAVAGNDKASAGALTTLTALGNPVLDVLIVQRPNTAAADLVTIALGNPGDAAILGHIRGHRLHGGDPDVVAALVKAGHLEEAQLPGTAGPALHALTDLNDEDLDGFIAQHGNTEALDLAVIAVRRAADGVIIAHIGRHALAGDPLVAAALEVAGADNGARLAIAQTLAATAEQLQALTLVNSPALDAEIVQRPHTRMEDLTAVLGRTVNPDVLVAIARHANTNAAMTVSIVNHGRVNPAVIAEVQRGAHSANRDVAAAIAAAAPPVRMVFSDLANDVAAGKITAQAAAAGMSQSDKAKLASATFKKKF